MSLLTPDAGLLFWMTLSFGIVLFILARYAFPKITAAIDNRNEYITRSLEEARHKQEMLSDMKAEALRIREEAKKECAVMIAEACELKNKILAEARQEAEAEAAVIRKKTLNDLEEYRRQMIVQAGEEIVNLSTDIAEKALQKELGTLTIQKELIWKLLEKELQVKE